MNFNQPRPVRNVPQATPNVLKCALVTLLILSLNYTTIQSFPVLIQRQETIVEYETIHTVNTRPTSCASTAAMKVLLDHFPARRENLSTFLGNCKQRPLISAHWKERTETSDKGLSQSHCDTDSSLHDPHVAKVKVRRPECVNDNFIHGFTSALRLGKLQEKATEYGAYHNDVSHHKNDDIHDEQIDEKKDTVDMPFCFTEACFCSYHLEICATKVSRANIGNDGPQGMIESIVTSRSLQPEPCKSPWREECRNLNFKQQRDQARTRSDIGGDEKNDLQSLVGLLRDMKYRCNPPQPNCHCPHHKTHSVEHIPTAMKRENLVASNIRGLKMFRKPTYHESSEEALQDQLSARFDIEDDKEKDEEYDLEKLVGTQRQSTSSCDLNHTECCCPLHFARLIEHVRANERRDSSTLSNAKGLKVSQNLEGKNPFKRGRYDEPQECQCAMCTVLSTWKEISALSDARDLSYSQKLADVVAAVTPKCSCNPKNTKCPCRDQRPHTVIHESHIDSWTTWVASSVIKAEQTASLRSSFDGKDAFRTSEHGSEAGAHSNRSPGRLDLSLTVPEPVKFKRSSPTDSTAVARRSLCSNKWRRGHRYGQHKPSRVTQAKPHGHVFVEPKPLSDTLIGTRSWPCHKLWMVYSAFRPAFSNTPKDKNVSGLGRCPLQRNDTLIESIARISCLDKEGTDRELCENNNRAGFWVVCALLTGVGLCGILLMLLTLLTCLRRKRPSSRLLDSGLDHKSGASTPSTSVSEFHLPRVERPRACLMRRIDEDESVETGSVRHYTTLDGATDRWTNWIFQKQKHGKKICQCRACRFSPTPITRAPRIPTLKLPQPELATMRKVSGLDSELEDASQGTQNWKGKGKGKIRVRWGSTVG